MKPSENHFVSVGTAKIEILGCDNDFIGLGAVEIDGVSLRDGTHPFAIRVDTPEGILYPRMRVEEIVESAGAVRVHLRLLPWPSYRAEFRDPYDQAQVMLADVAGRNDLLELILTPLETRLGDVDWHGFSYQFRFTSDASRIHRLMTVGSWELDGQIAGNTVLSQGQCNMPVYRGADDTVFTTTCLNNLGGYGEPLETSYQLASRGGLIQAFDFQWHNEGALFQYWPQLDGVVSWVESPEGDHRLHVVDEYRFELSDDVRTTPKHVLFHRGNLAEHQARNLWWHTYNRAYGSLREKYGVQESISQPEMIFAYFSVYLGSGRVEYGGSFQRQTKVDANHERIKIGIKDVVVDAQELPYALADELFPDLAAQGFRRFFCQQPFSASDTTEVGYKRKLDSGIHGDLHCASVCATHRFFPSEFWGGIKAWRYMADKAHSLGMEIGTWFAPHLSPRAAILAEHPEWLMVGSNTRADNGYGFQTIVTVDWNSGVYQWVLDDLKRWHDEGGIDFLFVDSYSNLGVAQVNFREQMRTNFDALGRFFADVQKIGIKSLDFESVSPWGLGHFGMADLRGDLAEEKGAVPGQNDFAWWIGEEDMMFNFTPQVACRERNEEELKRIHFRAMANRACIHWHGLMDQSYAIPDWWCEFNRTYEQSLPFMVERQLLEDDRGVQWESSEGRVLWAFKDFQLQLDGKQRVSVLQDGGAEVVVEVLDARAGKTYCLRP